MAPEIIKAINENDLDALKFLYNSGADINAKLDRWDSTALMIASFGGIKKLNETEKEKKLANKDKNQNSIFKIYDERIHSRKPPLEIINFLVKHGANPNAKDLHGSTVLVQAIENGNLEIVKSLIKNGASVNKKNGGGWTALMRASHDGYFEIVKVLLENGANPNVRLKCDNGWTALMISCREGYIKIVKLLVENDANPNIKQYNGRTAFLEAATKKYFKIAVYLLKNGAEDKQLMPVSKMNRALNKRIRKRNVIEVTLQSTEGRKNKYFLRYLNEFHRTA